MNHEDLKNQFPSYDVYPDGRVWSWKTNKFLKHQICHLGYHIVYLIDVNKRRKRFTVHRLVAYKYLRNPENYPDINHKDGNKDNNDISNLEWCTKSYNSWHACQLGLKKYPDKKLSDDDVIEIRKLLEKGMFQKDIGKLFNTCQTNISDIKLRKTWRHIQGKKNL